MASDFHVLPTPGLRRAARDCPLLERDSEAWIACCSRRFLPLARRIAGDDSLAEDVLQTSWIKIIQSVKHARFEGPKACPWVRTIVANTAENVRRQREQRGEVAFREEVDLHPDPEALAQNKELTALLRDSAANPHSGVAVRLRLFPGDEIAAKARFSRLYGRLLNQRTFTDQDGAYEFTGLPGGRVVAIAHVPGKTPVKQEKTLSEQGSPGDAYTVDLIAD